MTLIELIYVKSPLFREINLLTLTLFQQTRVRQIKTNFIMAQSESSFDIFFIISLL